VNVVVDGMHINSGGPNGMDPALSYIPRSQLQSLEVVRGIAPVSSGTESIGGTIIAHSKLGEFGSKDIFENKLNFVLGVADVNTSNTGNLLINRANKNHRFHAFGISEKAKNTKIPGGVIKPSGYQRRNFGIGYGFRHDNNHEISFNFRRNSTESAGTPALPMDIDYIKTDLVDLEYNGNIGNKAVHAKLYHSDVEHEMSNFRLRQPVSATKTRLNQASSDGLGYRFDMTFDFLRGDLMLGVDGHFDGHQSTIIDPVNNKTFKVKNFNDVERNVIGLFVEWEGQVAELTKLQFGTRFNQVKSNAGTVYHSMAGMMAAIKTLQNRFNDANKNQTDNNVDAVLKLSHGFSKQLSISLDAGLKSRAPSYQERYLWMPLQSTNGLADGHNYVGNITLKSEKAKELGVGLNWKNRNNYVAPQLFYRKVDDFIQGTPATDAVVKMVSTSNGDANPLQWDNVNAIFYGLDMDWGMKLNSDWRIDGVISYVRGERDDISDNLYRIAPLNGTTSIQRVKAGTKMGVEVVAYAQQNKVSVTNDEKQSGGYSYFNLFGSTHLMKNVELSGGIGNIFNKAYASHTAGTNRVADSGVVLGKRIPGAGRNYYLTLSYQLK